MKLKEFAYLPPDFFTTKMENLVNIARPERWHYLYDTYKESYCKYPILLNYISYTFKRLYSLNLKYHHDNYIYQSDDVCCFNTGLFTLNFEKIYALFNKNTVPNSFKWVFDGFYKKSAIELRKIGKLPIRATYFDNITDLIYDTSLELRINIDHILDDEKNKMRIPDIYRDSPNLPMLFNNTAIGYAEVRVMENYKAAVPQFFNGKIQFLLPISLGDPKIVDLSLAVEKVGDVYTGRTCLTLDMAYNNARQIAKPESDWLVGN